MSKLSSARRLKSVLAMAFALAALSVLLAAGRAASAGASQELPEGDGVRVVRMRCIGCHEADLIVSQRLSREGWVREVEKMIRWGATVKDEEKPVIVDYLAKNFGPRKSDSSQQASDAASLERGRRIFEARCVLCHEADLTAQQRLSRPGWVREVEKMMRWGAAVAPEEKDLLVDYLTRSYGPRK